MASPIFVLHFGPPTGNEVVIIKRFQRFSNDAHCALVWSESVPNLVKRLPSKRLLSCPLVALGVCVCIIDQVSA